MQQPVMFRGDAQHTGAQSGAMPAAPRRPRWKARVGTVLLAPVVADGLVLVASLEHGSQRNHGFLHALDAATGAPRWLFDGLQGMGVPGGITSAPALSAGRILFGSGAGSLLAVDLTSGKLDWEFKTGGPVRSAAVVAGDLAYFGSDDGSVYAVAVATGELKWKYTAGARVSASPVIDAEIIYAASEDGGIHALTLQGAPLWRMALPHAEPVAIAASQGFLLVSDLADGSLAAIRVATRSPAWTFKTGSRIPPLPAISNGVVCVAGGNKVTALELASGKPLWAAPSGGDTSAPVIAGSAVLTAGRDGKLRALSLVKGTELWAWSAGKSIHSELLIDRGTLYVGANGNQLMAAE